MNFLQEAQAMAPWLTELRRELHRQPEPGNEEFQTAACLCRVLTELKLEPKRLLQTAVTAELRGGKPGPTVVLRADMDALPIREETGLPFTSETPGMMHACGHDMHMAALLGAARLLTEHRSELRGTVRFLFQPDEEQDGGAKRMIEAGCMDGADLVFGAHVRSELPAGQVGIRYGVAYAASNPFKITLTGRSAHGAEPQNGADAIVAGAQIVTALQTLVSRRVPPTESAVVTVRAFHAGNRGNILAGEAVLEGILRTFGEESRRKLTGALTGMVQGIAAAMGVEARVEITWGYPGVVNDQGATALVQRAAEKLLGPQRVTVLSEPVMTTEDFGFFLHRAPGCYYHIGVGSPAPLHSCRFNPDEGALPVAAALHAQTVWEASGSG